MTNGERPALVLDFALHARGLRVALSERHQSGTSTVSSLYLHPIDLPKLHELNTELVAALNRANRWGGMDRGSLDLLRRRGQLLFDELLPQPVKDRLRTSQLRDLVLTIDEDLGFVPWELLHSGQGFLCLLFNMGRVVRTHRRVVGAPRRLGQNGPERMLIVCDPRSDLLASYYEGLALRDDLETCADSLAVALQSSEVGLADVQGSIRDYDILHYAGHADYGNEPGSPGGWKLWDGELCADDILKLAGGRSLPSLVFANACSSSRLEGLNELALGQAQDGGPVGVHGLAHAFLLAGVQHFVGTLWDVPDETACQFALAFYRALVRGESVGRSLLAARGELLSQYGHDSVLWASYALYGDPCSTPFAPSSTAREDSKVVHLPPPLPVVSGPTGARHMANPRAASAGRRPVKVRGPAGYGVTLDTSTAWQQAMAGAFPQTLAALLVAMGVVVWMFVSAQSPPPESVIVEDVDPTPLSKTFYAPPEPEPQPDVVPLLSTVSLQSQLIANNGQLEVEELADGAALPLTGHFQVQLGLTAPAQLLVLHMSEAGEIVELTRMGADELPAERRFHTVLLPEPGAWYYPDGPPGLHTILIGATERDAGDLEALNVDLVGTHRRILTESPEFRIEAGKSVVLSGPTRNPSEERVVRVMPVDRYRLKQALGARMRENFDWVEVRTFYAR